MIKRVLNAHRHATPHEIESHACEHASIWGKHFLNTSHLPFYSPGDIYTQFPCWYKRTYVRDQSMSHEIKKKDLRTLAALISFELSLLLLFCFRDGRRMPVYSNSLLDASMFNTAIRFNRVSRNVSFEVDQLIILLVSQTRVNSIFTSMMARVVVIGVRINHESLEVMMGRLVSYYLTTPTDLSSSTLILRCPTTTTTTTISRDLGSCRTTIDSLRTRITLSTQSTIHTSRHPRKHQRTTRRIHLRS